MTHVIFDKQTGRLLTRVASERSAKSMVTKVQNGTIDRIGGKMIHPEEVNDLEVMSAEKYEAEINVMVEVKNLMSGKPAMIPKNDVGTSSDPSQERYWTM